MVYQHWQGTLSTQVQVSIFHIPTHEETVDDWLPARPADPGQLKKIATDEDVDLPFFPNALHFGGGASKVRIVLDFQGTIEYWQDEEG